MGRGEDQVTVIYIFDPRPLLKFRLGEAKHFKFRTDIE